MSALRDHNLRAVESEHDKNARYTERYHAALAQLVKDATNEDIGEALKNHYRKDDELAKLLFSDSCEFAQATKRILRDYFSDAAREAAEDGE